MKTRPRASASASSDVARRRDALVGAALAVALAPAGRGARETLGRGHGGGADRELSAGARDDDDDERRRREIDDDDGETDDQGARRTQIPGTNPPILYYDLQGASGATGGVPKGARVAVHYDLKFRSVTVGTSRQGAGVTGGTPIGFTVGQPAGEPGGPFITGV